MFEHLQLEQIVRIRNEAFPLDSTSLKVHPDSWSLSYVAAFYLLSATDLLALGQGTGLAYVIPAGVVSLFFANHHSHPIFVDRRGRLFSA